MKKILFTTFIVGFSTTGLFAQNNNSTNIQLTQVGQFAWKRTAQDSIDIKQLPFMRETLYFIPDKNRGDVTGATYIVYPENGNNTAENKKK